MKTFIITSDTNYGIMVHVVRARTKEEAMDIAAKEGAWPGADIYEVEDNTEGLVLFVAPTGG